jgi:tetratricopeptide (TPR) repeat protein
MLANRKVPSLFRFSSRYSLTAPQVRRAVIKGAVLLAIFSPWVLVAQEEPIPPSVSPSTLLYKEVTELCNSGNFEQARALINGDESKILSPLQRLEILGMIETYAGDHPLAQTHFEKWCGLAPESHVARFNLGESLFLQKKFDRALIHFSTAETLATHVSASDIVELSRYKRVLSLLALARTNDANDLIEQFTLANANLSAKDFNKSLLEQVDQFIGEVAYPDDFTVLTCKILV